MLVPRDAKLLADRWEAFLADLGTRIDALIAAADAGSGGSSAFQARVRSLEQNVEEAWQKIALELQAIIDSTDDAGLLEQLHALRERESERARATAFEIELAGAALTARKQAEIARRLGDSSVDALHQLCHAAALDPWLAMERAERRFEALRDPAPADVASFAAATSAYWRKYCDTLGSLDPHCTAEEVEAHFVAKMAHFTATLRR